MLRRWMAVGAAVAASALVISAVAVPASARAVRPSDTLRAGSSLWAGSLLRSANGRYTAQVLRGGSLVVRQHKKTVWSTHTHGTHVRLKLRASGNAALTAGRHVLWASNTAGSRASALVLRNDGTLAVRSSAGTAWTTGLGNSCAGVHGKRVSVDLSQQFARLCNGAQQVLTTPITSGATALGDATPTGTWHLQSKQRDRYLYPAAGGAYYVHYWMPYDGAYGMHDSSWQKFAYGSSKYRTQGSHGCVHFPRPAIAWMFAWAPIGTTVHISA